MTHLRTKIRWNSQTGVYTFCNIHSFLREGFDFGAILRLISLRKMFSSLESIVCICLTWDRYLLSWFHLLYHVERQNLFMAIIVSNSCSIKLIQILPWPLKTMKLLVYFLFLAHLIYFWQGFHSLRFYFEVLFDGHQLVYDSIDIVMDLWPSRCGLFAFLPYFIWKRFLERFMKFAK